MANADKGVSSAGLITTVHPQARAAAAFEYMEPINDILLFFVFSLKILIVLYIHIYIPLYLSRYHCIRKVPWRYHSRYSKRNSDCYHFFCISGAWNRLKIIQKRMLTCSKSMHLVIWPFTNCTNHITKMKRFIKIFSCLRHHSFFLLPLQTIQESLLRILLHLLLHL